MQHKEPVIIVGGGWAGLAAAIELTHHNVPVLLLESAKQLGGRARSIKSNGLRLDNGQHLMLGAYTETLNLLKRIGVEEPQVFHRQPLALNWSWRGKRAIQLSTPRLPAPLHLLWALIRTKGLSITDRIAAIRFSHYLQGISFNITNDCSVQELLHEQHQPAAVIKAIWEPLCLGALNTHINEASAKIFLRTLADSFNHARQHSDLLVTRSELGNMIPNPGMDYIETHGGNVMLGQRVTGLTIIGDRIDGVELAGDQIHSTQVILATPHIITRRLVKPHAALNPVFTQLAQISDRPICTVYLQYSPDTRLEQWLHGSLDTVTQWIFDRSIYGQKGLMAVVISGDGPHMAWDNQILCDKIADELAMLFPHWPKPLTRQVIREKRATFASTVNIDSYRPDAATPVNGLWLAGDYTAVDLPATLEGAVRSGIRCARQVIHERSL